MEIFCKKALQEGFFVRPFCNIIQKVLSIIKTFIYLYKSFKYN